MYVILILHLFVEVTKFVSFHLFFSAGDFSKALEILEDHVTHLVETGKNIGGKHEMVLTPPLLLTHIETQ